jgi:hypothetical protein
VVLRGVWWQNNEDKSAASFCCQLAALVADMFCNFYFIKNHKISNNSTTADARDKNRHIFGIHRILEIFGCMFD